MPAMVWGGVRDYALVMADDPPQLVIAMQQLTALGWKRAGGAFAWEGHLMQAMERAMPATCTNCGHVRSEHMQQEPRSHVAFPEGCLVEGCDCRQWHERG